MRIITMIMIIVMVVAIENDYRRNQNNDTSDQIDLKIMITIIK